MFQWRKSSTNLETVDRLSRFPLLGMFLLDWKLRIGLTTVALLLITIALAFPRIWRTTPGVFEPVIKVSLIDLIQSLTLKRTALKQVSNGKLDDGIFTMEVALANNPGDISILRDLIRAHCTKRSRGPALDRTVSLAFWLFRLGKTNVTDVELVANYLAPAGALPLLKGIFERKTADLTPSLRQHCLEMLLQESRPKQFETAWNRWRDTQADPGTLLCYRAFQASFGPAPERFRSGKIVQAALEDPGKRSLAERLSMVVAEHSGWAEDFVPVLHSLAARGADELSHYLRYWRALLNEGRTNSAVSLASNCPRVPASPEELLGLHQFYLDVHRADQALAVLKSHLTEFAEDPMVRIAYSTSLLHRQSWTELLLEAYSLRHTITRAGSFDAYSCYLMARADIALNRTGSARRNLADMNSHDFYPPHLGPAIASELQTLGYTAAARELLVRLEPVLNREPNYWLTLTSVAAELHDEPLLTRAARKTFELARTDQVAVNNYVASLLVSRSEPSELVRLAFELYCQFPDWPPARVNFAEALVCCRRYSDALTLFERVDTRLLNNAQFNSHCLFRMEAFLMLGRGATAAEWEHRIVPALLFPSQAARLEALRLQLYGRSGSRDDQQDMAAIHPRT